MTPCFTDPAANAVNCVNSCISHIITASQSSRVRYSEQASADAACRRDADTCIDRRPNKTRPALMEVTYATIKYAVSQGVFTGSK